MEHITCNSTNVIIGIPSKGHLKNPTIDFLSKCGFKLQFESQWHLQAKILEYPNYKVVLVHPKDMPFLLKCGVIDIGFTGLDIIKEMKIMVQPVVKTSKGKTKICLMTPKNKKFSHPFHLMNKSIATSFPNITQEYFDKLKVNVKVYYIHGASEGMPYLDFVDCIVDVVETGISAAKNRLKIIIDDIFESECVAIVDKPVLRSNYREVNKFLRSIYQ